jgi:hypothetical protein
MSLFPSNGGRNDIVHHPQDPMTHFGEVDLLKTYLNTKNLHNTK